MLDTDGRWTWQKHDNREQELDMTITKATYVPCCNMNMTKCMTIERKAGISCMTITKAIYVCVVIWMTWQNAWQLKAGIMLEAWQWEKLTWQVHGQDIFTLHWNVHTEHVLYSLVAVAAWMHKELNSIANLKPFVQVTENVKFSSYVCF